MFYSTHILTKNGPFAKVWKAAIRDKKMTKSEIQLVCIYVSKNSTIKRRLSRKNQEKQIDLKDTVICIMQPPVPISCRTHGELMLGCVRFVLLL